MKRLYRITVRTLIEGQWRDLAVHTGDFTEANRLYRTQTPDAPKWEVVLEGRVSKHWQVIGRRTSTHPVPSTEKKSFFGET